MRTIFETNVRTSCMAGRLAQMRDSDMVKARPWWRYVHADTLVPVEPRKERVAWDGLVLAWDDPWWETHYPANGWKCSCGVRPLSQADLERMGRNGPDEAPPVTRIMQRRRDGSMVEVIDGIEYGWDYQPGRLWERGLVPSALIEEGGGLIHEGRHVVQIDTPSPLAELLASARPFKAVPMASGLPVEDYVSAFLEPFGAGIGKAVLWQDATGTRVPISEEFFRDRGGGWKIAKRGREVFTPLMA